METLELNATITAKGPLFDGRAPEIIRKGLLSAMFEATLYLEKKVKEKTPRGVYGSAGAGLQATIAGEVFCYGTTIEGIVGHGMEYGDVIEYGRRPGKKPPPVAAIKRWVEFKGIIITDKKTNKDLSSEEIAKLFCWSIAAKGFEGVHMFENTWNEGQGTLKRIFDKAGFDIAFHLSEDK